MKKFTAEEIVAGSKEMHRREEVLHALMSIMSYALQRMYTDPCSVCIKVSSPEPLRTRCHIEIVCTGHFPSPLDIIIYDQHNERIGKELCWCGASHPSLDRAVLKILSISADEIVAAVVREFPLIRGEMLEFAAWAPAQ